MLLEWGETIHKFIELNIELIDHNQFEQLWKIAENQITPRYICLVAEILISAGIDPTTGMNYIPQNMLRESQFTTYLIPSHIELIQSRAFAHSQLESMTIPSNVKQVEMNLFFNCNNLKEVIIEEGLKNIPVGMFNYCDKLESIYLPKTIKIMHLGAFDCPDIPEEQLIIYYNGTRKEFDAIVKEDSLVNNLIVVCTDETFVMEA